MKSASFSKMTIEWEDEVLTEQSEVTIRHLGLDEETKMPLSRLIAMTNGDVLAVLPGMV